MDFQSILAVNLMAVSALSLLLALLQRRRELRSFSLANALVLIVGGLALWSFPQEAGGLVSLVFIPLIGAPMALGALQARYARVGRLDAAARCADLIALFHPTSAMRLSAAFARAAAIEDPREKAQAFAALAARAPAEQAAVIETRLLADRGDWEKALVLAQNPENARQLASYRLRALGETGRIEEMIRDFARSADSTPLEQTVFAWLFVLAFAGRPHEVEELAFRVMRLDADTADYWIAVAKRHAGDEAHARAEFEGLAMSRKETPAAIAARRQLAKSSAPPPHLSPRAREIVEGVASRVAAESARQARGWRLPPATLLLIFANSAMFVAELALGGSQDAETLITLGALWAPLALHGESWRVLTSTLLHYGPLHFGLNMLMLALIGRELEHEAGSLKTFFIYLGGALFSSAFILALMASGLVGYGLYVGASGAIFALFGVVGALRIKDWLRHRASLDAFRATALGLAMLVQIAADFLLPMSSLAAHLSGFGFGLFVGLFVNAKAR
ncbi:rhomboid family protein [Methylocystis parvus]|uniref:Rhomboid family intramembrane serine protease n=1 Tax=Methylocystis parvus TaxID=134 RepID=A0A6B8M2V3_9HYPH|nr:rhomboid family intramembrane serine protease [Methylocystis parvus]QGM96688.1 rhomboid family intramembrane serine protease [Methylocystis parvus]WBJ99447.1 rhomboid family intramembrane serine protease [Methylocystis parvus OBBP]